MSLASKIRRNVVDYGPGATLRKLFVGLFGFIYSTRTYRIYRFDIAAYQAADGHAVDFEMRFLTPDDTGLIHSVEEVAEWLRGGLREKLRAGDLCLAATSGEELAGFNLVQFGQVHIPLINLTRRFREHEAWSEHIAVLPGFRKRGLAGALRHRVFQELKRRGVRRFYGGTLKTNTAALRLADSLDFVCFADVVYGRFLGRKFWRYGKVSG